MGAELYMTPALAELWLRYSSPAEMQEWTDRCLPSEYMASTADVVARLHAIADDCRFEGINVDDAIVTLSDFGRSNPFVLRLYVAHILQGLGQRSLTRLPPAARTPSREQSSPREPGG